MMLLKIERMNHTGEGIASLDGIIYFIPKTIPGDIIEVNKEDMIHYKNYNRVLKYKLAESSKKRIQVLCPYYQECGGCQLMGLDYKEQLSYKKEKVQDIFKKYANLEISPNITGTSLYQYRNKITLQVENGKLGLYTQDSNNLIPIQKCLLISDKLNEIINIVQEKIDLFKTSQIILKIMQDKVMIQFLGNINKKEVIKELSDKVSSIYLNDDKIYGVSHLKEELSPYVFYVSPKSFFQVNHEGTIIIYNKVKEYLGKKNNQVLDLYCGTGTIGIYVSDNCKQIIGIELNSSSVSDAKKNIKLNNIKNMKVLKGSVGSLLKTDTYYDAIIVDPPRSGLDKKTKDTLLKIKSNKLIYISCNPITLARDINILKTIYNLEEISLVDMFPNSYHCESISILERK